ncbi:uncharacterized protein LOC124622417 [Schistocerca americana]|uniref:uncharacterized protein LOC124622417 n=1 Tax=Schistocerca americana TaxID=7009 RepID=UPI001F4F36CC|nr:uncharacterized protein LOC124622417 [Schistocerca americana]XP_049937772.1 uncharacterized protein LOC126412296 [Schistocerca serialis cubense]
MLKKWSTVTIVHFLELYEERPCLWNHKYESYKDRNMREHALLEIVNYMRKIVPDCNLALVKAKIRSIRNAYINEYNKILKSRKNGASADDVYKPTVGWYATADRFLKYVVETREAKDTLENEGSIDIKEDNISVHSPGSPMTEQPQQEPQSCIKRKYPFHSKEPEKRPKSNQKVEAVTEAVAVLREITEKVEELKQDELDAFGKTVVAYLRKMPDDVALDCQAEIINYLISQKKALLQSADGSNIHSVSGTSASSD